MYKLFICLDQATTSNMTERIMRTFSKKYIILFSYTMTDCFLIETKDTTLILLLPHYLLRQNKSHIKIVLSPHHNLKASKSFLN